MFYSFVCTEGLFLPTVGLGIITISAMPAIIKRLVIKMMQPFPHVKAVQTNIVMIPERWGAL